MSKLVQKVLQFTCQNARRHVANVASISGTSGNMADRQDAFTLMKPQMSGLMEDIHKELESEIVVDTNIGDLAK